MRVIRPSLQVRGSYNERGHRLRVRRHDWGRFFSEVPWRACDLQYTDSGSRVRSQVLRTVLLGSSSEPSVVSSAGIWSLPEVAVGRPVSDLG